MRNDTPTTIYYWMGKLGVTPGQIIAPLDISFRQRIFTTPVIIRAKDPDSYSPTDYAPVALLEMVFEFVRFRNFPLRPCRFESLFLWDNEDWARQYHNDSAYAGLYIAEIANAEQVFKGDFTLITDFQLPDTIKRIMSRARRYWKGELEHKYEIVLKGTIKVVSRIA